jgi:hypothetical protein
MQTYEGISQSIIDFFKKETYNELSWNKIKKAQIQ